VSNSTRPSSTTSSGYDERFVVPLEASRRGAHRARVSPVMAVLPVAAVLGVVIGAFALVYLFFGMGGSGAGSTATTAAASPTAATTASPSATPDASASGMSTASDSMSSTASQAPIDRTLDVAVYNGSSVSGMARKASSHLITAGWKVGTVATWPGATLSATTVFYATDAQRATAAAVAKSLGRGVVKLSAARAGITVVVGTDYALSTRSMATGLRSATRSPMASMSASPGSMVSPSASN
jgi:LytR cell envelope-related transcriptional attenuator